jgi:hypothetical protein
MRDYSKPETKAWIRKTMQTCRNLEEFHNRICTQVGHIEELVVPEEGNMRYKARNLKCKCNRCGFTYPLGALGTGNGRH